MNDREARDRNEYQQGDPMMVISIDATAGS
jgi:hypothetical protein